jgi:hypothetical protein
MGGAANAFFYSTTPTTFALFAAFAVKHSRTAHLKSPPEGVKTLTYPMESITSPQKGRGS